MRTSYRWLTLAVAIALTFFTPLVLVAQQVADTAAGAVTGPDGSLGGLIGAVVSEWFWPVVGTIQSSLGKLFEWAAPGWSKLSNVVKRTILYFLGYGITWVCAILKFGIEVDGTMLTTVAVIAAVPSAVVMLVYRLAGIKIVHDPLGGKSIVDARKAVSAGVR